MLIIVSKLTDCDTEICGNLSNSLDATLDDSTTPDAFEIKILLAVCDVFDNLPPIFVVFDAVCPSKLSRFTACVMVIWSNFAEKVVSKVATVSIKLVSGASFALLNLFIIYNTFIKIFIHIYSKSIYI